MAKTNQEVLNESTRVAKEAAKTIGGTYEQGKGFTPGEKKGSGGTPDVGSNQDFINALQDKLLSSAQAVSSSNSNIEDAISGAIKGTREATQAESKRIESQFGREIGYAQRQAEREFQDFGENRSGFATQMTAFRNLVETTDKELKDLEQRKQELILQNNSQGAQRIVELQMQALEFQQEAKQQAFDNIFKTASFGLQAAGEQRAAKEFAANYKLNLQRIGLERDRLDQTRDQAMASLASEFGVEINPGDTLDDIVNRVAPLASEERRLKIKKLNAEIQDAYGNTNSALAQAYAEQRVADIMANEPGISPSAAVLRYTEEARANDIGITPEETDRLFGVAQGIRDKQQTDADRETNEISTDYWSSVFRGLDERAAEDRQSRQERMGDFGGLVGFFERLME